MQLFAFLLSFFLLSSGFPSLNFSPNIFVPKNLTVKKEEGRYFIFFNAYNPNDTLLGYNIYYAEDQYDIQFAQRDNQAKDLKTREKTRETYIIPNNYEKYPSILVSDLKKNKQNPQVEVIWIKHELKKPPKIKTIIQPPFYIAVTAVIFNQNQESRLSEIISFDEE